MYNIIPVSIIILSLAIIIAILIRKVPAVASIDIKQLPEEKQKEIKNNLIRSKIQRGLEKTIFSYDLISKKLGFLNKFLDLIRKRVTALEEKYSRKNKRIIKSEPGVIKEKVAQLLSEAEEIQGRGEFSEVEKKYIEVIELDPLNIDAYRGLGNFYLKQNDFDEAKQTFEHVLKLIKRKRAKEIVEDYINLSFVYRELGEGKRALAVLKKTLRLEPNNPRNLDLLCEASIIVKDKDSALRAYKQLKEVNPENQKLEGLEERIREIN